MPNLIREQALTEAQNAAAKAKRLAQYAESAAHSSDPNHYIKTNRLAEAGALWADTARAYTALALALPEPPADDENTEA
ncbi:hypothetical protein [Streptomyces griseorubiginosus]|uniref:hypothetical protein n=1 Tax=Streptomyces griseorubiginosus TaxID=67304 RepID=UPI002E81326E|nr:hypothetical protein [Streptomyces griseorubiginosus]WUB45313.1 hypothetical protein OHN19_18960 [Streptomyces griseorubiginosus]WUB53830.1 hypothetical protein OG942_18955 [Streptomyces griseorubiginosus]